jgi:chromosome segregation ATPase
LLSDAGGFVGDSSQFSGRIRDSSQNAAGKLRKMKKASKALVIAVTVFTVIFMGVAAVMSTARTDWKEKATKEFPSSKIADQRTKIQDFDKNIEDLGRLQKAAEAGIAADEKALVAAESGREAALEVELQQLIDEAHNLADQVEAAARKVEVKQDEDKRLREEVTRLKSQYDDLVAQKDDALASVKRLKDLLFQAKGVLERVEKRQKALDAEKPRDGTYEERPAPAAPDK